MRVFLVQECVMFVNAGYDRKVLTGRDVDVEIVADRQYEGGEAFSH